MLQIFTKRDRGFTLIELLVVIAIIGILATIVLVSMTGVQQAGRDTARKADMRQIVSAMQMYYGDNEAYLTDTDYPSKIGSYMLRTPEDPSGCTYGSTGTECYGWIDNTGNDQQFCAYADLEDGGFYTATHAGTFEVTDQPANIADCLPPTP